LAGDRTKGEQGSIFEPGAGVRREGLRKGSAVLRYYGKKRKWEGDWGDFRPSEQTFIAMKGGGGVKGGRRVLA